MSCCDAEPSRAARRSDGGGGGGRWSGCGRDVVRSVDVSEKSGGFGWQRATLFATCFDQTSATKHIGDLTTEV